MKVQFKNRVSVWADSHKEYHLYLVAVGTSVLMKRTYSGVGRESVSPLTFTKKEACEIARKVAEGLYPEGSELHMLTAPAWSNHPLFQKR